jgi:hypothetical protein
MVWGLQLRRAQAQWRALFGRYLRTAILSTVYCPANRSQSVSHRLEQDDLLVAFPWWALLFACACMWVADVTPLLPARAGLWPGECKRARLGYMHVE